ncbi:hypothetical protein ABDJ41_03540 [Pedobacter sp. ASV1-7]|jgi:hypothetical protein|uniref:hypothetical protein n=1 Tax=Pedobacter sp. ASV1-7 TaxID=3145237 RepID=UPI0032E87623
MEKTEYRKPGNKDMMAAYSLLALVPPLGMLFIIVDWYKGAKVDAVSVFGLFLGIVLTVVYYMQLTGQM